MRSSAGRSTEADVGAQRPRIATLLAGRVGRAAFFVVGTLATACALAAWTLVTPAKPAPGPFAQAHSPVGRLALTLPASAQEVAELESRAAAGDTAEDLARLGGTWLANGYRDRAIGKLEEALATWPRNGAINNQLAVAYLDRAIAGERPIDLVRALGAANRAMVTSPRTPEPPFNRALILQRLELREVARRAWQDVAAHEVDPRWLRQANSHLQRLDAQPAQRSWERDREELERGARRREAGKVAAIVERWPEPARLFGEEDLLARWASAAAAGREAEAKDALATAEAIGSALAHRRGDLVLGDAVAAIVAAQSRPEEHRLRLLVEGHRQFGDGLQAYKQRRLDEADVALERAAHHLSAARSPMAHWARLYLASSQFYRQHLDVAIAALERLGADTPLARYPSLEGRLRWLLGGMDILRSRPGEALADLRRALELLEAAGEVDGSVGVHYATAMVLGTLGDTEDAWLHLYAALVLLPRLPSPVRATACLQEAGIAALQLGELEAALDIQDELVLRSLALGEAETVAVAKLRRAETLARLGRHAEARQELAAARTHAARIAAPSLRARLEVEISLAQAEEELGTAPTVAARRATEAIDFFDESDFQFYLPLAHVLRARARFAAGDERGALADYFASLDQIESTRRNALDPQLQITFFDQSNALFDQTLAVLAQPGRDADASFAVVERGRARDLLDRLSADSDRPPAAEPRLSLHALQQQLPADTLLVRYALLPDRLLIWWLTKDDKGFVRVSTPASVVETHVDAAARALQGHRTQTSLPALRWLHRTLLGPVAPALVQARSVVFVPDKALHRVPFAALVDPASGQYLIERHEVGVAPSAQVYVQCLRRQRELPRAAPTQALIVGASEPDRRRFPALGALAGAQAEARVVAALYPSARLLAGEGATRDAVLGQLAHGPQVLHLAGHSLVNASRPDLSMFLLAAGPQPRDSGVVYAHEIEEWPLAKTGLAVLAGCGTAAGEISASEGAMSLSRPFLAAGVPAVVGSLWRIDDDASASLMTTFHRRLRAGDDPQSALRRAQLAEIRKGGAAADPGTWAPFQLIGGVLPSETGGGLG